MVIVAIINSKRKYQRVWLAQFVTLNQTLQYKIKDGRQHRRTGVYVRDYKHKWKTNRLLRPWVSTSSLTAKLWRLWC